MGACCSAVAEGGDNYGVTSGGPHGHGNEGGGHVEGDSTTPLVNTHAGSHVDYGLGETHEMLKELGRGGTGETYLCRVKATGELVAVKFIKRPIPKVVMPMILHEIQIQADIGEGHVNIINAHEVVLTKSHIALVMEYAAGGSMTSYVADRWETTDRRGGLFLSEEEARFFFRQFLLAVEYCHGQHVAHRDLKLDNTLLDASKEPLIKICDFGFAKNWGDMDANMFTQIGTPVYMSPQLINSRGGKKGYDGKKADVWASGVLLFVMLLGMFPFEHQEHPDPNTSAAHIEVWLQQVKSSWRENPRVAEAARRLSAECQDLLDKIFNLDEKARITVQGIKSHPWFNRPLLPEHQAALDRLKRKQEELGQLEACDSVAKHRDEALQVMMQAAARQPLPGEKIIRVDLRRLHAPGSAPDAADTTPALHKGSSTTPRPHADAAARGAGRGEEAGLQMAAIRETDEDPDASTVTPEAVKVDS